MLVSQTPITSYLDQWSSPFIYCPYTPMFVVDLNNPALSEFDVDDCEFVS